MKIEKYNNKKCLLLKNGLRFWINEERVNEVKDIINKFEFIDIEGNFISKSMISGFYNKEEISNLNKIRRGLWQCEYGNWHKNECRCEEERKTLEKMKINAKMLELSKNCNKCERGWLYDEKLQKSIPCKYCCKDLFSDLPV